MNHTDGDMPLEGLDLRMQVLHLIGFTVTEKDWDGLRTYSLRKPDGTLTTTYQATPKQAWEFGPAVESSVDAAQAYLILPAGYDWDLHSVSGEWVAMITNRQGNTRSARHPSLAVAMCRVFWRCMGGDR